MRAPMRRPLKFVWLLAVAVVGFVGVAVYNSVTGKGPTPDSEDKVPPPDE
jgi:hypothetical protein